MVKKAKSTETPAITPEAPKPDKNGGAGRGHKPSGLLLFTLIAMACTAAAILLGSWVIKAQVLDVAVRAQGDRLANAHARQFAGFYNQIFSQASQQLSGIITAGNIADLLVSGDEARIRDLSTTIAASLANHSKVFLLPNTSPVANIPLGFAAQEMVERARRGEPTNAEIVPLKEQPLLLLAYSVRNNAKDIVGVMLVGFDLKSISANLKVFEPTAGYMTLQQKFADSSESMPVMAYGDAAYEKSLYTAVLPTTHPNLTVSFALNPQLVAPQTDSMLGIAIGGMLALVFLSIIVTHLFLRRSLQRNASMLLHLAENLIKRTPSPAGIHFSIDIFEDVAVSLNRTARLQAAPADGQRIPASVTTRRPKRGDILDVDVPAADAPLLDPDNNPVAQQWVVAEEIFRAYDIRGVVGKSLTDDTMLLLGRAIGSEAIDNKQTAIYVGRDGRLSGPHLLELLIDGITSTGCNVVNLGMVPTPVVYFACANTAIKSGICLTGSHNPPDYNGLKIVINGETLAEQRIQALKQRIKRQDFRAGKGTAEALDISGKYLERIRDDIVLARTMKIVVDCGNGVAGALAPQLLSSLGCKVIPIFCDVDGHFPNHHPDPSNPDNLADLIARVIAEKADLGLAFDGDGDRIGVVTPQGKVIWPDRLMMLYARDLLMRNPGADIIFDVKCSRDLALVITQHGGRPIMWRTGHSLIKAKLKETGAALAGEMSGHIFFNDRWFGFDDAIYAAARLLEILALEVAGADELFAEFPSSVSTPELHISVNEDSKFRIVDALQKQGEFGDGGINTIDGVRVDYPNSWGLVRASNTTPMLVARFEGRTSEDLDAVREIFRVQLLKVEPSLRIPF